MGRPGLTSVCRVPSNSPPRNFTAPTSVIAQLSGEPPVVSRSRTTNVTSDRGVPRSSKLRCMLLNGIEHVFDPQPPIRSQPVVAARYRCDACGNLTRFDVIATRRTREFHHYNLGGD